LRAAFQVAPHVLQLGGIRQKWTLRHALIDHDRHEQKRAPSERNASCLSNRVYSRDREIGIGAAVLEPKFKVGLYHLAKLPDPLRREYRQDRLYPLAGR